MQANFPVLRTNCTRTQCRINQWAQWAGDTKNFYFDDEVKFKEQLYNTKTSAV